MTQTTQSRFLPRVNKNECPPVSSTGAADTGKPEANDNLSMLLSIYDNLEKLSTMLEKLDHVMKKNIDQEDKEE